MNENDAAAAIADMLGTDKWPKFVKELGGIMENTVDDRMLAAFEGDNEESGFVAALIAAIGAIGGAALNLAGSSKAQKVAKENAKSQMIGGITAVLVEREKLKAEKERTKQSEKKNIVWIIVASLVVVAIIVGMIIYKRNKAAAQLT